MYVWGEGAPRYSLSFFLCLWKDRLLCHFSMCLGRQTSVLFCKTALQDRLVCGLFYANWNQMLQGGRHRRFTDLLWKCQHRFSWCCLFFAESAQELRFKLSVSKHLVSEHCKLVKRGFLQWLLDTLQDTSVLLSGLDMRTCSFHENVKKRSCYFSVLNNSRSPALPGTRVMHSRLLYIPIWSLIPLKDSALRYLHYGTSDPTDIHKSFEMKWHYTPWG